VGKHKIPHDLQRGLLPLHTPSKRERAVLEERGALFVMPYEGFLQIGTALEKGSCTKIGLLRCDPHVTQG
jgi:hypothetical protein